MAEDTGSLLNQLQSPDVIIKTRQDLLTVAFSIVKINIPSWGKTLNFWNKETRRSTMSCLRGSNKTQVAAKLKYSDIVYLSPVGTVEGHGEIDE